MACSVGSLQESLDKGPVVKNSISFNILGSLLICHTSKMDFGQMQAH